LFLLWATSFIIYCYNEFIPKKFTYKEASCHIPRRSTTSRPQPCFFHTSTIIDSRRVIFSRFVISKFVVARSKSHCNGTLKSTSQTCSPMASFYSTFRQISLLPSNPITVSYRLTTIKITFWRKWSISIPRASWQSLVRIAFRSTWFSLLHLLRIRRVDAKYSTQSHEDRYWKEAAAGQRDLQRSDARFVGAGVRNPTNPAPYVPPLVMYYTPALLPEYRDSQRRKGKEARSKSPRPRKDEKQAKKPRRKRQLNKRSTNNITTRMGSDSVSYDKTL
jgi:hypothetical protein